MRVTTRAYTTNYLKNNNSLLGNLLKSESKILSQKKYTRASEDSVSAAKAAHVRKSLENLNVYDENCKTAKDLFCAAEDALYDIANKTYLNVYTKVDSVQDTMSQTEYDIIAQEISELAGHMIQDMNSDFSERQMFGCTSNDKTPFMVYSSVRVFDKDGNEINAPGFGNIPDTAEQGGAKINTLFMNDQDFYDEEGNVIDLAAAEADTVLYDKDGQRYPAYADGAGGVKDLNGNTVTVYKSDQKFYDEDGNEITDMDKYDGDVYYDGPDTKNAVKFTVVGENDRKSAPLDRIVCYNDVPVNLDGQDLLDAVSGGTIVYYDKNGKMAGTKTIDIPLEPGQEGNADAFPGTNPIYVDIGLGINYSKLDATALDLSLNGAKITGCGTDKDGDAKNLIQLIYDTAKALRAGDYPTVNKNIDKLDNANNLVLNAITDLGIKQNNMDYHIEKNSVYRLSLQDKQNEIEGTDLESEITNWKTIDAAYKASLSMGSQVLPKSLFDFI